MRFITLIAALAASTTSVVAAPQPIEDSSHLLVARTFTKTNCDKLWNDYGKCCMERDHEWSDWDICNKDKIYKKKTYDDCCKKHGHLSLIFCKWEKISWDLLEKKCAWKQKDWLHQKETCEHQKVDCDKYCPRH